AVSPDVANRALARIGATAVTRRRRVTGVPARTRRRPRPLPRPGRRGGTGSQRAGHRPPAAFRARPGRRGAAIVAEPPSMAATMPAPQPYGQALQGRGLPFRRTPRPPRRSGYAMCAMRPEEEIRALRAVR